MFRKGLSVLLSAVILFACLTALPFRITAAEVDMEEVGANSLTLSQVTDWLNNEISIGAKRGSGECVDFCNYYLTNCWGISAIGGNAGTWKDKCPTGWTSVNLNGSFNNCQIGDLLVEDYSPGHVSVYYGIENGKHMVVDQNNNGRRYTGKGRLWADFSYPMYCFRPNYVSPTPQGHVMSESEGAGPTIPDGDYWICSKIAQNYFLDIPGDNFNTQSGTNLETWIWDYSVSMDYITPGKWDVFHFKYLNNGFYQITQYNTNLAVDVVNASLDCGANVQMYGVNNAYAQQWSIEKTDSGYKLRARCNNYYMDIDSGNHQNGTNVLTWEGHDGIMQRFSFIPYAPDEKPLADGKYVIQSSLASNCYLDVEGYPQNFTNKSNVQIYNKPDDQFQIEYVGNGYYRVYETISKYAVEVINEPSYLDKNKNVILYTKSNSRGQFWKIKKNSDGTYYFINELSGYYMDVYNGSTEVNTNVQLHPYNGSTAQRWIPYRVLSDDMVAVKDVVTSSDADTVNPTVTVKVDGKTLTKSTDYTVDVTSDIVSGTGTVTVTGKGNYTGSVTKDFNITINDTTVVNDFFGNKYETEQGEIITYYANLTSPIQVSHINGIIYYNQEVLEPIIADDIGYNVPAFDNGHFQPMGSGQLRFDVYSSKSVSLNNVMVIRMQFRVIKKGGETWLGHQFETPEFTYENKDNYELEAHILTNQVLYDSSKVIRGDVDGDGFVTIIDVTMIQRKLVQLPVYSFNEKAADIDGDGLDITDATRIQRYLAEFDDPYHIGEVITE